MAEAQEALLSVRSSPRTRSLPRKLHAEMCGPDDGISRAASDTPEKLLVDRIVLCWLHLHDAETLYAQNMRKPLDYPGDLSPTPVSRLAHNRYLSAIRTLAQVRRLQVPAVQVNIAEKQLNVAAITSAHP